MHTIPCLKVAHLKHHRLLQDVSVWGGFDQDALEVVINFGWINAPFLFLSVTPAFYLTYICGGAVQTALIHGTQDNVALPWPLVNASHHYVHHVRPNKQFGAGLLIWDNLCGTGASLTKQKE